ncbi:hypothetical protein D3C80_1559570 [compost metagenome]
MSGAGTESGVNVVVFKHMPDILHPANPAPLPELVAEVLRIQPADNIHVAVPDNVRLFTRVMPEEIQLLAVIPAQSLLQQSRHVTAPRE